ncbi:MAG: hypothetical protein GF398_01415 [Chitinivibrionales bacterium]|nr:hypothetical protein [Chitinivibrionales bacterium]
MPLFHTVLLVALAGAIVVHPQTLVFPPYGHSYGIRKATQGHLKMFLGPFASFEDPQGLATAKMVSRDDPSTKKDDDEVVVYGVNSGKHQIIYNTSMWGLASYGREGSGKDELKFPKGITCDEKGNVYIADWGNDRIVHLFNPQKKVEWVDALTGKSAGDPGLKRPQQVSLTEQGWLVVSDRGNRRIVIMSPKGKIIKRIPAKGVQLFQEGPTVVAAADGSMRWSHYHKDRFFFCTDQNGRRLWKIGLDGTVIKKITLPGGHQACYGAVDYYHNIYLTDIKKHCVVKLSRHLKMLDVIGSYGKEDNQFIEPRGIAVWKRFGQTFIAEQNGAQYYWVGTKLKSKNFKPQGDSTYLLQVDVSEHSYVSLFTAVGADTSFIVKRLWIPAGPAPLEVNDTGKILNDTAHTPVLRLEPTYSSYTYYHWDFPLNYR